MLVCPFCGSSETTHEIYSSAGCIECSNCGAIGPDATPDHDIDAAAAKWNTRPASRISKIQSAPKDRDILGWFPELGWMPTVFCEYDQKNNADGWAIDIDYYWPAPTHWMEMPPSLDMVMECKKCGIQKEIEKQSAIFTCECGGMMERMAET